MEASLIGNLTLGADWTPPATPQDISILVLRWHDIPPAVGSSPPGGGTI
jgi:hypothetical protein